MREDYSIRELIDLSISNQTNGLSIDVVEAIAVALGASRRSVYRWRAQNSAPTWVRQRLHWMAWGVPIRPGSGDWAGWRFVRQWHIDPPKPGRKIGRGRMRWVISDPNGRLWEQMHLEAAWLAHSRVADFERERIALRRILGRDVAELLRYADPAPLMLTQG